MLLKRIEVHGFKSFAESTIVNFEPNITSIVGPNGSGKSNIVDAVRWVLGEQSAKSLRGSKMEDIIFAGSDKRKQMKKAEVVLVLDNSDGTLPIEYSEVSIGRRVDRTGSSDYLINGSVCRLKDVEELIMDTGIGKEAYSIVGQGKIDVILSSKPTDRRELFEEAAGIIKYKTKKQEATRRLNDTEANLTRTQDIIQELDRQAEPLKKQAEDARKYKEYSSELKELEEGLLLTNWALLQKELHTYESDRDRLDENLQERENLVNGFEEQVDHLQQELDQMNEEIDENQEAYFEAKTRRENMENNIQMLRERQNSLLSQQKRIHGEIQDREDELNRYLTEEKEVQESIVLYKDERENLQVTVEERQQEMKDLAGVVQTSEEEIAGLKAGAMDFMQQRSDLTSRLNRYQEEAETLQSRIDELIQLRSHNDQDLDTAVRHLQEVESTLKTINEERITLDQQEEQLRQKQARDQNQLQSQQERFLTLREEFQGVQSRLKLLKDMEDSMQGYYQGVKNVLSAKEELSGVVGVLAELIHVDAEKEKAIGAALGGGLQNIVVERGEDAKTAIQYLKRSRGGRATFLPMDMVRGNRMQESPAVKKIPGYLGIASDFVQAESRLMPIILNQLGRIVIAQDMDAALKISRAGKQRLRIVTLDGDTINPGGSVSGGSSQQHRQNLLGRSREIEELTGRIAQLKDELNATQEQGLALRSQVEEQEQRLKKWQERLHQLELKRANLRKDLEQLQKDTQTHEGRLQNVDQEFEASYEKMGSLDVSIQQCQQELDLLNQENQEKENKLKTLESAITENHDKRDYLQQEITDIRIKLASLDEQERGAYSRLEQLATLKEENQRKIAGLNRELEHLDDKRAEFEGEIQDILSKKIEVADQEEDLNQRVIQLKRKEKDLSGALKKEESRARTMRRKVNELSKEVSQCQVKIAKCTSKLDSIREQLNEEYGIDIENFSREITLLEDLEKVEKRIRSLKWRLRVLGTVNLGAEEEYETLTKRLNFLKEQHDDLTKARESLDEMIGELDETIKVRFKETFEKVKVEFEEIFTKLFGGGSAQLLLSDPENMLETGVEINAQPPGKKLQKLSLMSGGEKALTALALIFAFLKVKPSPFYILDEIDAPLDEANVERFATFVREFCSMAQFIIVTHRNRTMAEADALYGVTMEESGVSKLISYKFTEKAS